MPTPVSSRALGSMLCLALVTSLGCQEDTTKPGVEPPPTPMIGKKHDPADFTVSYRSLVRVPDSGIAMKQRAFVEQVGRLDPLEAKRCPVINDAAFEKAPDALGGITWTHPVAMLKNEALPPLYRGRIPPPQPPAPSANPGAGDSAGGPAPTIVRPDLIGYQEDTAIFLSQRHGLLTVKTGGPSPVLSCALKLPGQPKYFFYLGNELVLLVNSLSGSQAALLRFRVNPKGFDFLDAVMLDQQSIQDARLFDRTLIVYTNMVRSVPQPVRTGGGGGANPGGGTPGAAAPYPGPVHNPVAGVALTAIKWDLSLTVAWHEEFLNDPTTVQPFSGQDPVSGASKLAVGDVVAATKTFKPFISASDRYVVVSRDVSRTLFSGTRTQTYSHCASYRQGPPRTVQACSPKYEQRANPDYKPPQSLSGDYHCNGQTLLQCIQQAAPTVSQYIYVRVGETCTTHTYHDYFCERQETRTVSYPTYSHDQVTQFVVYRYDDGDFIKLDERIYEMADPGAGAASVAALNFKGKPLEVDGGIDHKGDLQFQRGHFYVLTNQGQRLHTLLIIGNSIAKLGAQPTPRQNTGMWSYSGAHSTLFSHDRMMVSRAYYDQRNPMNIPTWSDVIMLDLTIPAFPRTVNQFVMPGSSDQLILANDGILGPGTVAFSHAGVPRNLQKLTLFNRTDARELGNVLLGTEFNANLVSTWLGVADDQRIRLDGTNQRLFLPYSGHHHAPQSASNPVAHRLNITAVANGMLTSEMTFDVVEDIVRTVSTSSAPNAGRALAFGESSVYAVNQIPGSWAIDAIEEFATPMAVYRFNDKGDLHARIDRIGTRCQISTFSGGLNAFKPDRVGVGPHITCPEWAVPVAIGSAVVFGEGSTGWQLSADGRTITALEAAAVKERLTRRNHSGYCAIDATIEDGTPVPHLDEVPPSIVCFTSR